MGLPTSQPAGATWHNIVSIFVSLLGLTLIFIGFGRRRGQEPLLRAFTPEHYEYSEASRCAGCKGQENAFMPRAAGVDPTSATAKLFERGWLSSLHAMSQSHDDRVDTACAWCHAPTAEGATSDKDKAGLIPKGSWQGVSCGACHPGSIPREERRSLLANFIPGADRTGPDNFIFRDRSDGKDQNLQCRFCHHESHDLLLDVKEQMLRTGALRCIDCHMAAYAQTGPHVERAHDFKVAANLPHSCSGGVDRVGACHADVTRDWYDSHVTRIKGPRKTWTVKNIAEAAKAGNIDRVKNILAVAPKEIDTVDERGYSALHWAAMREHWDIFKWLLDFGPDVNAVGGDGGTPVHWACHHDRAAMVGLLIDRGGTIHLKNRWGRTPLHVAARRGCLETASLLIERGADLEAATDEGWTPLHVAYRSGHASLIELLLSKGASPSARDAEGRTPPELHVPRPDPVRTDPKIFEDYVGDYEVDEDFAFEVRLKNNRLSFQDYSVEEIYPIAPDTFFCRREPWTVRFFRNEEGDVVRLDVEFIRRTVSGLKKTGPDSSSP